MDSGITLNLPIPIGVLWLIYLLALVSFMSITWIFFHHWKYYGVTYDKKVFVRSLYLIISIILFVLMAILIGMYQLL